MKERTYLAIDLKSFFASVECVERGLDPLTTNLVVADAARTEKPSAWPFPPPSKPTVSTGRPRLFEVVQQVATVNAQRRQQAPGRRLTGSSHFAAELQRQPALAVDYIVAPPQMAKYLAYSSRVYSVYLRHVAPEDIHVYSIDEVFIDATDYLTTLRCTARQFAMRIVLEVLQETGITATAGIGSNLYLSKVAMDIVAKHIPPDRNGVRVAMLNEDSYRRLLWDKSPPHRFLAGGTRLRQNTGPEWSVHHGRYCLLLAREAGRAAQRGAALPAVRRPGRAAHRPCLGLGTLHHCRHQGLPAKELQS